jgi:hypothetical protein
MTTMCAGCFNIKVILILSTQYTSVYVFRVILRVNEDHFLNRIDRLAVVTVAECVFFEVRTTFFSVI